MIRASRLNFIRTSLLALLLLSVLGLGTISQTVMAQENRGFTVSPLILEPSANRGDKVTHSLKVDNITDQPMDIGVDRRNFLALGEEGQPEITEEDTPYSLASWMKVTPETATIAPKSSASFNVTIDVPQNAEPGGHFGSIVFKTRPASGDGRIAVVQEIGALVLLKIAGEAKESASIESFSVSPRFSEDGPFKFDLRLKNSGNVHYKPITNVTITNMFGKEVGKLQVDSRNVLPSSVRKFSAEFKKPWLWGRHTATATVVYGSSNQVLVAQTTFWAFPVRVGLIALGILLVLGILIFVGRKRIKLALGVLFGKDSQPDKTKGNSGKKRGR